MESLAEKALRHLRQGHLDPATLLRGTSEMCQRLLTRHERLGDLTGCEIDSNHLGVTNLTRANYSFDIPATDINSFPFNYMSKTHIEVIEFPLDASFQVLTTPLQENGISFIPTNNFIEHIPEAIATFTGPTYSEIGKRYPNNGFYHKDLGEVVPFRDTNPSGQKRGAFLITDSRQLVIIDDDLKWQLIRSGFPSPIQALIGTSNYLKAADKKVTTPKDYQRKSQISYLVQALDLNDHIHTSFVVSTRVISIPTIRTVIEDYMSKSDCTNYIAVELELSGASCTIRGANRATQHYGGTGFHGRRDHYVVFPGSSTLT